MHLQRTLVSLRGLDVHKLLVRQAFKWDTGESGSECRWRENGEAWRLFDSIYNPSIGLRTQNLIFFPSYQVVKEAPNNEWAIVRAP
jgi:hypothetical protein